MARNKPSTINSRAYPSIGDIAETTSSRIGVPTGTPCLVVGTRSNLVCEVILLGDQYKGKSFKVINKFDLKIINQA
jgi:hypothetical protein